MPYFIGSVLRKPVVVVPPAGLSDDFEGPNETPAVGWSQTEFSGGSRTVGGRLTGTDTYDVPTIFQTVLSLDQDVTVTMASGDCLIYLRSNLTGTSSITVKLQGSETYINGTYVDALSYGNRGPTYTSTSTVRAKVVGTTLTLYIGGVAFTNTHTVAATAGGNYVGLGVRNTAAYESFSAVTP